MIRKLLVATDGSDAATTAVRGAIALAGAIGGSLVVLHVYPEFHGGAFGTADNARRMLADAHGEQARAAAAAILDAASAEARSAGVSCATVALESDRPWQAIVAVARRRQCDAVCMGSHGRRGLAAVVLGSETARVLTHCTLPVLIFR
jgi:nucleotide-binding universal stress UspA family protein